MAASSFAIDTFMSKVENLGGIARKNRFSVEITPPASMTVKIQPATISFLAKTISFPARSFGTTTYRSGGQFALTVPYETTYEPVTLSMLNTNNQAPRKFWTDWINYIQRTGSKGYNMQYYKKFIGQIKITSYDETVDEVGSNISHQVTLHEAYPKSIGAIEMGWESSELAEFEIEIAYARWTSNATGRQDSH
tara:strand:- start:77 stop:655 length:579 start_codon:yes stop_codon:yes gene_type:complete